MSVPAGDERIIAKWKQKLSPYRVLNGEIDGRTVSGLGKLVVRLEDEKEFLMAAMVLKNYHQLCKLCETSGR